MNRQFEKGTEIDMNKIKKKLGIAHHFVAFFIVVCMVVPQTVLATPKEVMASTAIELAGDYASGKSSTRNIEYMQDRAMLSNYALAIAKVTDKAIAIRINGDEYKQDDTTGYADILNDRTMVPIRLVTEGLGYNVDWDDRTETITMTDGNKTVVHIVGDFFAIDDAGIKHEIDSRSFIDAETQRTMVSIRLIAEAFGCIVNWVQEGARYVVNIIKPSGNLHSDGYAEKGISRGYLVQAAASLRFYKEGDKYYVSGELPTLPDELKDAGLYAQFAIQFRPPNMLGYTHAVLTVKDAVVAEYHQILPHYEGAFVVELPSEIASSKRGVKMPITDSLIRVDYAICGNESANQINYYGNIAVQADGKTYISFTGATDSEGTSEHDTPLRIEW